MSAGTTIDSVNDPRHPFGLPMGSVRGFMSLLICAFFWLVLLWPGEQIARPLLGHFFLLFLVLLAFASSHGAVEKGEMTFLPWLMRVLFVGGTVLVVAYALVRVPEHLQTRLTPDPVELKNWWGPFMAIMLSSFAAGNLLRFLLGRNNVVFMSLRAWLSVVGMVMLAIEFALFLISISSDQKMDDFLRYWQALELGIVSAYFGARA